MDNKNLPVKLGMAKSKDGTVRDVNLFVNSNQCHYKAEHCHTFFDFSFVERGRFFQCSDGKKIVAEANDFFVVRPECVHKIETDGDAEYVLYNMEVSEKILSEIFPQGETSYENEVIKKPLNVLHLSNSEAFKILRLMNLSQSTPDIQKNRFYLKLVVSDIISKLITEKETEVNPKANNAVVSLILSELNKPENFTLTIAEICSKANYSQGYVIKIFRKSGLELPNKIFLKSKLNFAAALLKTSDIKVISIADMCGLYSLSYFNRVFKSEFGVSPSVYRKKYKVVLPDTGGINAI